MTAEQRPNEIITAAQELYAAGTAVASFLLAQCVVIDYGRGDIPNTVFEAAGTILGVALTVIVGKEAVKNLRKLNQSSN
ncbi:MAG: hypothetical protein ABSD69_01245 [Candidatus Levyibacteriota bacterium]|jgi:hypothetical protein